jgi:FlgN protein
MSRQITDLLGVIAQIIAEQHKLLGHMELQHIAMKKLDLEKMNELMAVQEASRLRLSMLDNRRKAMTRAIASAARLTEEPTISRLAVLFPNQAPLLLAAREELRDVIAKISLRSRMSSKLTGAVLGHLNTVGRLISGAMQRAGVYTKQGVRQMSGRIGVMDAVG